MKEIKLRVTDKLFELLLKNHNYSTCNATFTCFLSQTVEHVVLYRIINGIKDNTTKLTLHAPDDPEIKINIVDKTKHVKSDETKEGGG